MAALTSLNDSEEGVDARRPEDFDFAGAKYDVQAFGPPPLDCENSSAYRELRRFVNPNHEVGAPAPAPALARACGLVDHCRQNVGTSAGSPSRSS
jgi:hypothetical protein